MLQEGGRSGGVEYGLFFYVYYNKNKEIKFSRFPKFF